MAGGLQYLINTIRDKVVRGAATTRERAILEYYEATRGSREWSDVSKGEGSYEGQWAKPFMDRPFNLTRAKDWVKYREAEAEVQKLERQQAEKIRREVNSARHKAKVKGFIFVNGDEEDIKSAKYNPNPGSGFFTQRSIYDRNYLNSKIDKPREFTTLDIETDDMGRPISVSALKQVFNKTTGSFDTVDNFQRFYLSKQRDLSASGAVHGLTEKGLKELRRQQNADYGKIYNKEEMSALQRFLGSSIVVGHNIIDFDLPHLFSSPINNQVIDTLTASRNQWKNRKNDLDSVFRRLFGKTMAQAGLSHHDASSDVIANAMIAQKMLLLKGRTGESLRYVATHEGTHIAPEEVFQGRIRNEKGELVDLPAKYTQVIRGSYADYQNVGAYMDADDINKEKSVFEMSFNEDTKRRELPEGYHEVIPSGDINDIDNINDAYGAISDAISSFQKTAQSMGTLFQQFKEAEMASSYTRGQQTIRDLSRYDSSDAMRTVLSSAYGIDNENAQDIHIRKAMALREARIGQEERNRQKAVSRSSEMAIMKATWQANREGDTEALDILSKIDSNSLESRWSALQEIKDRKEEQKRMQKESDMHISEIRARREEEDAWNIKKKGKIDRFFLKPSHALVGSKDREAIEGAESFEELATAMAAAAEHADKLSGAFNAIAKIPVYNLERLESAFKGQVGGIAGAARGVIPKGLLSPLTRLTSASLNSMDETYANLKFGTRAAASILPAVGAAVGTIFAPGIGTVIGSSLGGAVGAGTQIIGNIGEAGITKWGEGVQNNLNTLGFLQDMVLMPFRLLRSAINGVLKGLKLFSGALKTLVGIIGSGLGTLTSMGNPLTGMTGVTYGDSIGLNSIDAASLLSKGTTNSIMNDFATQRMKLYTTGQVDTNRLVAASMIGMFDSVYGSRTNDEDAFTEAMNMLRQTIKGQSELEKKQTYVLANMVNPNMAAILQTMDTLGIDDVNEMKRPRGMWGYDEEELNGYRKRFQRSQWEYQYGGEQLDVTKGRIATSLWNGPAGFKVSGKGAFNVVNKFMDSIADALETGNWESVGSAIKGVWETIKNGVADLWESIKSAFGIENTTSFGDFLKETVLGWGNSILDILRDKIIPTINSVWDSIVDIMIDKFTGLISYLSTIKVDFKQLKNLVLGKEVTGPIITHAADTKFDPAANKEQIQLLNSLERAKDALDRKYFDPKSGFYDKNRLPISTLANGSDPKEAQRTSHMYGYIDEVLRRSESDPFLLKDLNTSLTNSLGYKVNLSKGDNARDFLDFVAQRETWGAVVAGTLYPQWMNDEDIMENPFNKGAHGIMEEVRGARDAVAPIVADTANVILQSASGAFSKASAVLDIRIKDDKNNNLGEAKLAANGDLSVTTNNNRVELQGTDGGAMFNLQESFTTARW